MPSSTVCKKHSKSDRFADGEAGDVIDGDDDVCPDGVLICNDAEFDDGLATLKVAVVDVGWMASFSIFHKIQSILFCNRSINIYSLVSTSRCSLSLSF